MEGMSWGVEVPVPDPPTSRSPIVWDDRASSLCNRVSPPARRRSSERSAAVIDRLSAGPYIRRREVGVPATVVPQLLQRCGWKTIQKWTFTGFCVAEDTASVSKPPARIGKISCTIFTSFFFLPILDFCLVVIFMSDNLTS